MFSTFSHPLQRGLIWYRCACSESAGCFRALGVAFFAMLVAGSMVLSQPAVAGSLSSCKVAREIAIKGIGRFDSQRPLAIAAIRRAYDICDTDPAITYNLGLAWYLDGQLKKARELWEGLYKGTKNSPPADRLAMKVHANLAWLRFEMGDDEDAHLLAFAGVKKYPGNLALAHTKYMSLLRMARYLEAYDWLSREKNLTGSMPVEWLRQSAGYLVENLWRQFRSGKHLMAIKDVVDFLVKEYPEERAFVKAKEQLLVAEVDPNAEIAPLMEMPDDDWPKTGKIDERSRELDSLLLALPPLDAWKKRDDAFAVFVGIARYRKIESRHFGDRDAQNMHTLLTRRGPLIDDADHTRLRTDDQANLETILRDLEWLSSKGRTHPNALLLFYFSGLGAPWVAGGHPGFDDGLLLPVQADRAEINPQTAISLKKLKNLLANLPDREIVVILDTCFHGRGHCGTRLSGRNAVPPLDFFTDTRGWALASVQGDAGSVDAARQGAFTFELITGLLGDADGVGGGNRDGWVNLGEAFHFAKSRLKKIKPSLDTVLTGSGDVRLTRTRGEQ